ncbi:hypothetical protein UPYG_G00010500 [Umbra pygmaea]|uniref:Uncharacterized protein n=1 Tax=Umbra pygmaea TaxID=75934 RepID=A0ABD0XLP2_UMBPY
MKSHRSSQGQACSQVELVDFCQNLNEYFTEYLNTNLEGDYKEWSEFSLAIVRILDFWGDVEQDVCRVKEFPDWKDVLSLRLVVTFIELNHQYSELPFIGTQDDFLEKWVYVLSRLAFAQLLSERLQDCWLENVQLKLNLTTSLKVNAYVFDSAPWQISATGVMGVLAGTQIAIQALKDTQDCLFARAVPALKLQSRAVFSGLSMRIALLTLACLIYPLVLVSFKQMTEWIQNYSQTLRGRTEALKHQRHLAEDLLHQMLPKTVAKQLRQQRHVEAESYEEVRLIRADGPVP